MQIEFTIPDGQVARVVDALNGLFPQPEDGELTAAQWSKEVIRQYILSSVRRYEQRQAIEAAQDGVAEDDSLVS